MVASDRNWSTRESVQERWQNVGMYSHPLLDYIFWNARPDDNKWGLCLNVGKTR